MTCKSIMCEYGYIIKLYDVDKDGKISKAEATQATLDYFDYKITKEESVAVVNFYNDSCSYDPNGDYGFITCYGIQLAIVVLALIIILYISRK